MVYGTGYIVQAIADKYLFCHIFHFCVCMCALPDSKYASDLSQKIKAIVEFQEKGEIHMGIFQRK